MLYRHGERQDAVQRTDGGQQSARHATEAPTPVLTLAPDTSPALGRVDHAAPRQGTRSAPAMRGRSSRAWRTACRRLPGSHGRRRGGKRGIAGPRIASAGAQAHGSQARPGADVGGVASVCVARGGIALAWLTIAVARAGVAGRVGGAGVALAGVAGAGGAKVLGGTAWATPCRAPCRPIGTRMDSQAPVRHHPSGNRTGRTRRGRSRQRGKLRGHRPDASRRTRTCMVHVTRCGRRVGMR